jgi:uncharacterized protein (DUF934 family)
MTHLIKRNRAGQYDSFLLPQGCAKPAPEPRPIPDMAIVNQGQGDARSHIRPNVAWPDSPSVTHWEGGAFERLNDYLAQLEAGAVHFNKAPVALVLMSHEDPLLLEGRLDGLHMIAIDFPRFSDGRGFSLANLLRTRLHWHKEMRAIGDVLIDQLFFMQRCGFDAFALRGDQDKARALKAFHDFPAAYQHNADGRDFVLQGPRDLGRKAA